MAPGTPQSAGSSAAFQLISPPARTETASAAKPVAAATPATTQASSAGAAMGLGPGTRAECHGSVCAAAPLR